MVLRSAGWAQPTLIEETKAPPARRHTIDLFAGPARWLQAEPLGAPSLQFAPPASARKCVTNDFSILST